MHQAFRHGFEKHAETGMCHCPHCGNPVVLTAPVIMDPEMGAQTPQELEPYSNQDMPPQMGHMQPNPQEEPNAGQAEANPQTQAGPTGLPGNQPAPGGETPPPAMRAGIPGDKETAQGDRPPTSPLGNLQRRSARDYGEQYAGAQSPYSAMY